MLEYVRQEANQIADELWALAKSEYGLERTAETEDRIQSTFRKIIMAEARKAGLTLEPVGTEPESDGVNFGLVLAFVAATCARDDDSPRDAIRWLLIASNTLTEIQNLLRTERMFKVVLGSNPKKSVAAALAKMRHAEHYAMIDDALKHWRENIDPSLSAAKAANELLRVVPLSHKKLAAVIAAEKKKQI